MRVGVTLPQFRSDADAAVAVARRAEAAGLDGVFAFDHLWPLGRPDRPALQSTVLLGALAGETERVVLGTLVARVGLVPDAVLVHQLVTLGRITGPDRWIAAVGTGDRANRDENRAYGVPFPPAAERLGRLIRVVRALRAAGVRTWVGGLSPAVVRAAREADGWNGWGISVARLAEYAGELAGAGTEVTWAGQVRVGDPAPPEPRPGRSPGRPSTSSVVTGTVDDLARHLGAVASTGATWAVCAPVDVATDPSAVDRVAEAARAFRSAAPGAGGRAGEGASPER